MGLKIDFHVHTRYSGDSFITFKQIISYSKKRGLNGIAITDHNIVHSALKHKTKEILMIPGIEVSTIEGHVLGINVTTSVPRDLSMEETIERIHEVGGIAIAPHPTSFYKSPPSRKIKTYDAIEVINASSIPFSILTHFNKKFADRLGLPQVGGSDSHYAPEIGSAYTVVDADQKIDEIIQAIKDGYVFPVGKQIPWKFRLERIMLKLKKKFRD